MIDLIEKLCIESGIYNYLYVNEIKSGFEKRCNDSNIYLENVAGRFSIINRINENYGGGGQKIYEIGGIRKYIKTKLCNGKDENIKYLIINIEKDFKILSIIQNIVYILMFFPCKVMSLKGFYRKIGLKKREYEKITYKSMDVIIMDLQEYQLHINGPKESFYLKRVIADYLYIRDFKNAKKYSDILVDRHLDDKKQVSDLIDSIEDSLVLLKKMADNKCKEHIVWNWVDNVCYKQLCDMPYLNEIIKKGINYTNIYTLAPYTSAVMHTVMTGKVFIDDGLFRLSKLNIADGKLISDLQSVGYNFCYIGEKYQEYFNSDSNNNISRTCQLFPVPSTVLQYELLLHMAHADNKTLYLVHNLNETHPPFQNPVEMPVGVLGYREIRRRICENNHVPEDYKKQILLSYKYIDAQLEFYHKYYSDAVKYEILFSDHGACYHRDIFVPEEKFHTVMCIMGKNITPKQITSMQTVASFPEIVMNLVNDDIQKIGTEYNLDYVMIQFDDVYFDPQGIALVKEYGMTWFNLLSYFQFRGVITKEDCYVRWASGIEYYQRCNNSQNLISEPQWQNRIDILRNLTGNKYINTFKEEKYKKARKLYQLLNLSLAPDNNYV